MFVLGGVMRQKGFQGVPIILFDGQTPESLWPKMDL